MATPAANAAFLRIAGEMINPQMTPTDYEKLRHVAEMLNPDLNGYVRLMNEEVARVAPLIKRR